MGTQRNHYEQHQSRASLDSAWKEGMVRCEGEGGVSCILPREKCIGQTLIMAHRYQRLVPTGTFAEPEEVAHAVSVLVQDLACNINGADIRIDGGFTIR